VIVTDNVPDFATLVAATVGRGEAHPGVVFAVRPAFDAVPGVAGRMTRAVDRLLRADERVRGSHFLQAR
jgi:hypothetical protein